MTTLSLRPLSHVDKQQIIDLMRDPRVVAHLPLAPKQFAEADYAAFIQDKQQLWQRYGLGPSAVFIEGVFAGWGGLQPEGDEVEVALVLYPQFWGWGRRLLRLFCDQAFRQMALTSVSVLFPLSRSNAQAITRLGFVREDQLDIAGQSFIRYRLAKPGA